MRTIQIKNCKHNLAKRERACADGGCPICLLDRVVKQRLLIMEWEALYAELKRQHKLLLRDSNKLRNRIKTLDLFDPNQK